MVLQVDNPTMTDENPYQSPGEVSNAEVGAGGWKKRAVRWLNRLLGSLAILLGIALLLGAAGAAENAILHDDPVGQALFGVKYDWWLASFSGILGAAFLTAGIFGVVRMSVSSTTEPSRSGDTAT